MTLPDGTGVLLVNLGTPDAPTTAAVRRYLRQFLMDPRVIDVAAPLRFTIVHGFVLPFRPRRSAEAYAKVWTEEGSPLLVHGEALQREVQARLGEGMPVALGMRYGRPSIAGALEKLARAGASQLIVLPLFPQYSSAAWGSAVQEVQRVVAAQPVVPAFTVIPPFYEDPRFVAAVAREAEPLLQEFQPDRVLFSFHGLPERQVKRCDATGTHCLVREDCCAEMVEANRNCYRAQCFATARAVGKHLGMPGDEVHVAFQSRLGRTPWVQPYSDQLVLRWADEGVRRILVLCPSFVADCLETLEEVALRLRDSFRARGGEDLRLVPCVNASKAWVDAVAAMIEERAVSPAALCLAPY